MISALMISAALLYAHLGISQNVRVLRATESEVSQINTALGYSTILQFDTRPSSAVLGDQDAFKVEYVGNSLTIKPLRTGIRTNLFVFTEYERFNFRLVSGGAATVDYLVKVSRKLRQPSIPSGIEPPFNESADSYKARESSDGLVTKKIRKAALCHPYSITVTSVSYPRFKPWLIVNFSVSSRSGKGEPIEASSFEMEESGKPLIAETLYLESLQLPANATPVHGTFMISRKNSANLTGLSLLFHAPTIIKDRCSKARISLAPKSKGIVDDKKDKN